MKKINYPFDLRLYIDEYYDKNVVSGILLGVKKFLNEFNYEFKLESRDYDEINDYLTYDDDSINLKKTIDELMTKKEDIYFDKSSDEPHWDLIITNKNLKLDSHEYVFGHSTPYAFQKDEGLIYRPDLAHIIISSIKLVDDDDERAWAKGYLTGFHESAHIFGLKHCNDDKCIFYQTPNKMLLNAFINEQRIHTCKADHEIIWFDFSK